MSAAPGHNRAGRTLTRSSVNGASPGLAFGRARTLRAESDLHEVSDLDVVVMRHATATMLPALLRARAAVCERGGVLNHLAVLARELGKPCVTGVAGILEAVEPGAWIQVDGTRGIVEVTTRDGSARRPAAPSVPGSDVVAVMQFGRFGAAFERLDARVDERVDVASLVAIASLASVSSSFGVGPAWDVTVRDGQVLVRRKELEATVSALVRHAEDGRLRADNLRSSFDHHVAWSGWTKLRNGPQADRRVLAEGVHRYAESSRLVWAATLVREALAQAYREFLRARLPEVAEAERERLYLESLIVPGASYIAASARRGQGTVWGPALTELGQTQDGADRVAAAGLARRRLEALLPDADAPRLQWYLAALGDLVDLTERKNTDLHRCAQALFTDEERRREIARLLRLPPDGSAETAIAATVAAVARLGEAERDHARPASAARI